MYIYQQISEALLEWYDHCRRDLPWRKNPDAYRVWVSEIMLQQTRVEVVGPYYERFMQRFPSLGELAAAPEEEVLTLWQGLGYYSRARNLQKGVREVAAAYGGVVPATREQLQKIAGIGEYTAGAILSIAYNQQEAAVDGNVLRVFSRLFCITDDVGKAATRRQIQGLVRDTLPPGRAGDFNQALMDLGAAVCIPKHPRCDLCPLSLYCIAKREQCQQALPVKGKKAAPRLLDIAVGVLARQGEFLICRRPNEGLLANMWQFPMTEVAAGEQAADSLCDTLRKLDIYVEVDPLPCYKTTHIFSHRQWNISVYCCSWLKGEALPEQPPCRWLRPEDWEDVLWAGPHARIAAWLQETGIAGK